MYDKGLIEEVWVALLPAAIRNAAAMFEETKDPVYTMIAVQVAGGNRRETCLLIMRIGRYTVVEGPHDYRIHVFNSADPAAPLFYQEEYDAEKLSFQPIIRTPEFTTASVTGKGGWSNDYCGE